MRTEWRDAAGTAVNKLVSESGFKPIFHVMDEENLVPNEEALGEIMMARKIDVDIIVAVGTGTVNDICKFISFHMGIPYIIVATAPSMDGFTSSGAPLVT